MLPLLSFTEPKARGHVPALPAVSMAAFEEALLGEGVGAPQDDVREGGEADDVQDLRDLSAIRRRSKTGSLVSRESWESQESQVSDSPGRGGYY